MKISTNTSADVEKPDEPEINLSLIKNAKTRKRMRSDNNNASSSKKVRPNLMKISTNTSADVEKTVKHLTEVQKLPCTHCGKQFII